LLVAGALAIVSFAGCVLRTSGSGPNAAFYFMHWRAWEFVIGGVIAGPLVKEFRNVGPIIGNAVAAAGATLIGIAIVAYDASTLFPSWRALLPALGAALVILSGLAFPQNIVARCLAVRPMTFIGLISYSWYLWHWPALSLVRITRMGETSLLVDCVMGGAVGFVLACLSYRYIELPIRTLRRERRITWPSRKIFGAGIAAGISTALIGGLLGFAGNIWLTGFIATKYGLEGKPRSRSVCRVTDAATIPAECTQGRIAVLLGDSHAAAMFDSLSENAKSLGTNLIYVGRGGCDPLLLVKPDAPSRYRCADLLSAFSQMLTLRPKTVIVTPPWVGNSRDPALWRELFSHFDPSTRILVIGLPPPMPAPTLACIVLSDRYLADRSRCTGSRPQAQSLRALIMDAVRSGAAGFSNIRIVDPIDLFCDEKICRPFKGDQVFYKDQTHLETPGVDLIQKNFSSDVRWAMEDAR
ncbi:MAG: acyltransferase, partial [Rhizobiales bacterium]|nr:acyltransferase [Hyphomicrobiales bacterium]